jgi:hypothetical protein
MVVSCSDREGVDKAFMARIQCMDKDGMKALCATVDADLYVLVSGKGMGLVDSRSAMLFAVVENTFPRLYSSCCRGKGTRGCCSCPTSVSLHLHACSDMGRDVHSLLLYRHPTSRAHSKIYCTTSARTKTGIPEIYCVRQNFLLEAA